MRETLRIVANLHITVEDADGKVVDRQEIHNTWLENGRWYLIQLMTYNMYPGYVIGALPPDTEPNLPPPHPVTLVRTLSDVPLTFSSTASIYRGERLFYTGVGIGGNQQTGPVPAAVDAAYPGTNAQANGDPTITGLERAARVRTDGLTPVASARWLKPFTNVDLPVGVPLDWVRYITLYDLLDVNSAGISGGAPVTYGTVPLSEVALYPWTNAVVNVPVVTPPTYATGSAVAYAAHRTINKTALLRVIYDWRFQVV